VVTVNTAVFTSAPLAARSLNWALYLSPSDSAAA
jgi:hypothetical protein